MGRGYKPRRNPPQRVVIPNEARLNAENTRE